MSFEPHENLSEEVAPESEEPTQVEEKPSKGIEEEAREEIDE